MPYRQKFVFLTQSVLVLNIQQQSLRFLLVIPLIPFFKGNHLIIHKYEFLVEPKIPEVQLLFSYQQLQ